MKEEELCPIPPFLQQNPLCSKPGKDVLLLTLQMKMYGFIWGRKEKEEKR